jgi:hypothetical protein
VEVRACGWEVDWEAVAVLVAWVGALGLGGGRVGGGGKSPAAPQPGRAWRVPDVVHVDLEPWVVALCDGAEARLPMVTVRRAAGEELVRWSAQGASPGLAGPRRTDFGCAVDAGFRLVVRGASVLPAAAVVGTWSASKGWDVQVAPLAATLTGGQVRALAGIRWLQGLAVGEGEAAAAAPSAADAPGLQVRVQFERVEAVLDALELAPAGAAALGVFSAPGRVGVRVDGLLVHVAPEGASVSVSDARAWEELAGSGGGGGGGARWPVFEFFDTGSDAPKRLVVQLKRGLCARTGGSAGN